MSRTKARSPRPRKRELPFIGHNYHIVSAKQLSPNPLRLQVNFFNVVERRRTRRIFRNVTERLLSSFLWWTAHTQKAERQYNGFIVEYRPTPSAGGRHPIDLLLIRKTHTGWQAWLYEPMTHRLLLLRLPSRARHRLVQEANKLIPIQRATIIWLVSQPARTTSKYLHGENLILRDAGVLIGHMALVAEALNLSYCPLGATGEPIISSLFGDDVAGVGGCLLGG